MRILIAWDKSEEAELLRLYLTADSSEVEIALTADELYAHADQGAWDAVLLSLTFPKTGDEGLASFIKLQNIAPNLPVVMACRDTEMMTLPRFLTRGLRHYMIRDPGGNFVFLALGSLESAVTAARAEEHRKVNERLREEMDGVRRLQESMIPRNIDPPPGYQIAACYEPSEVNVVGDRPVVLAGGDYYDVFRPDERTLVVLLGDASGHGLKACMAIMAMHTLIRLIPGDRFRDTAAFVTEVNQRLCENAIVQSEGGFITLFYAAIDTITHTMRWTSAGHPLPLLQHLDSGKVGSIGTEADGGMPLGISPGIDYSFAELTLPPSSRVAVFTDGLTDAFPVEGSARNPFGVRGVSKSLQHSREANLQDAMRKLLEESHAFTGGSGRHDDTTVVLVERNVGGEVNGGIHERERIDSPIKDEEATIV